MHRLGADCLVVVRHRHCRPTASETLVSHCRVVGIELRRIVCFFVVLKRGNARGAKGMGHRHLARVNRQREEPDIQWKAAAFVRWHEPDDARVSTTRPHRAFYASLAGLACLPKIERLVCRCAIASSLFGHDRAQTFRCSSAAYLVA
jgi:hypothetical protein